MPSHKKEKDEINMCALDPSSDMIAPTSMGPTRQGLERSNAMHSCNLPLIDTVRKVASERPVYSHIRRCESRNYTLNQAL